MTRRSSGHGGASPILRVRKTRIDADEIVMVAGVPSTTLARTVADQARLLPFEWGVVTADAALRQGLADKDLQGTLEKHPLLRGLPRARAVAALADGRSESPAESLSRAQMHLAGLPKPELQFELFDAQGEFVARCDFGWPELGLVGEVDGRVKYEALLRPGESAADVVMREKQREEAIRDLGYWLIRWDWAVASDRRALERRIRAGIEQTRRRLSFG